LKQLWERISNRVLNNAQALYSSHQERQTKPNIKELSPLLRTESDRVSTFFIVLDALDEFDSGDMQNARTSILWELGQILNVRVMITGRTHVQSTVLSNLDDVATLPIRASDSDIRRYLDARIEKVGYLGEEVKLDQDLRATIIDGIIGKADGMYYILLQGPKSDKCRFLVASLQLQVLAEQTNKQHILSALNQLPRRLDQTYEAALSRITNQSSPDNVELALKALNWLTFAREHLQATALQHALIVKENMTDIEDCGDQPNIQVVVSLCGGLVTLEQESGTIRLVHETTQQYLQIYFRNQKEDGDAEIAKVCLRYFSFPAFSQPFENTQSVKEHLTRYPLSRYASRYWFIHVREGGLEEKFVPTILKTFETQSVRYSVYLIAGYREGEFCFAPSMLHLLHLASKHGLCILCREILQPLNKIQSLYFLLPWQSSNFSKIFLGRLLKVWRITEVKTSYGTTPLHYAAIEGHVDVVKLLLKKGANIKAQEGTSGATPLYLAVRFGQTDVARVLLEKWNEQGFGRYGGTLLRLAARDGNIGMVRTLVEKGAHLNAQNMDGYTPVHLAAEDGHIDVIRLLLEKGANVDARNGKGLTPLLQSAFQGNIDVVRFLLEEGADMSIRTVDGRTLLHWAAKGGDISMVRLLVEKEVNLDSQDESGETPLHLAANWGNLDVVLFLLEKGANVNAQAVDGRTPLHLATRGGDISMVRLLVEKEANLNAQDKEGETPLHLATYWGDVDVVRLLLEKGANAEVTNRWGCCPLANARERHVSEVDQRRSERFADSGRADT
jgi:ankyrin repeat protein